MRIDALTDKVMSADEAAALIRPGANVGMSGFTGAGYPKEVPAALARRITEATQRGEQFKVGVWTGASTAPELDGALAEVEADRTPHALPVRPGQPREDQRRADGLHGRAPLARRPDGVVGLLRAPGHRPGRGRGHDSGRRADPSAPRSATTRPGSIRPITSFSRSTPGSRSNWRACTTSITAQQLPPNRKPIQIVRPADRIGSALLLLPPGEGRRGGPDAQPGPEHARSRRRTPTRRLIAGHVLEFLASEVKHGPAAGQPAAAAIRAWATSPTPSWPAWTMAPSGR